ncbi:MAG: DUF5615 family PIN-like protein [Fidelibacterota bacterium]
MIDSLRKQSFEIISILENYSGITDIEVLEKCVQHKAVLLTEDNDFGEWIFSHHKDNNGVIFLRYQHQQLDKLISTLLFILKEYNIKLYNHFTVLTTNKIRMRKI